MNAPKYQVDARTYWILTTGNASGFTVSAPLTTWPDAHRAFMSAQALCTGSDRVALVGYYPNGRVKLTASGDRTGYNIGRGPPTPINAGKRIATDNMSGQSVPTTPIDHNSTTTDNGRCEK